MPLGTLASSPAPDQTDVGEKVTCQLCVPGVVNLTSLRPKALICKMVIHHRSQGGDSEMR